MELKKGSIVKFDFEKVRCAEDSKMIKKKRRAVVLHTEGTPYKLITIAPITKAEALEHQGKLPDTYIKLEVAKYPTALTCDSYIDLDMVTTVDEDELVFLELFENEYVPNLHPEDLARLEYGIALKYELQSFIKKTVDAHVKNEISTVVNYIDQDIRKKVISMVDIMQDDTAVKYFLDIIDNDIVKGLKDTYLGEHE